VTDFRPAQEDRIVIAQESLEGVVTVKFEAVTGRQEARTTAASNKKFIYDTKSSMISFNENGKQYGFCDGGEFARLLGAPELSRSDLVLV